MRATVVAVVLCAVCALVVAGLVLSARHSTDGDMEQQMGKQLISAFGCGGCHSISGISNADGRVGPSLRNLSQRRTIAGSLVNTPENVAAWIDNPKAVNPTTLMPDLGVDRSQAEDIAAYLYSH